MVYTDEQGVFLFGKNNEPPAVEEATDSVQQCNVVGCIRCLEGFSAALPVQYQTYRLHVLLPLGCQSMIDNH